ncbi:hypothetical protein WS69_11230 [Burkholderia sp. BDU5]|nr:hypothetical protein WS69_11230 [Burkholderia sp. BDU5]
MGRCAFLSKELELKRRQFAGGVVEMTAVNRANDQHNEQHAELIKLQRELAQRQDADAAQTELQRILTAVA